MPSHPVQPPEWIDAAPIRVDESIEIADAPSVVWSLIADHRGWPEWFTDLDAVEPVGDGVGVGGGRRVTVRKLPLDEEFTAWEPNAHFAFAVTASKVPILGTMAESVRLEPLDDGARTRVVYRQGLQARRWCGPLLTLAWKRAPAQLQRALGNLRTLAEARAA